MKSISEILKTLYSLSLRLDFKGHDPYDGLYQDNLPCNLLKKNKFTRLILIERIPRGLRGVVKKYQAAIF